MSAWLCSPKEIAVVALEFNERFESGGFGVKAEDLAEKMARLNLRSVAYRYNQTEDQTAKESSGQSEKDYISSCRSSVHDTEVVKNGLPDQRLWGVVSCYLYQSCERDDCFEDITYRTVAIFEKTLEKSCEARSLEREGWGWH